jgi:hypothetical protein
MRACFVLDRLADEQAHALSGVQLPAQLLQHVAQHAVGDASLSTSTPSQSNSTASNLTSHSPRSGPRVEQHTYSGRIV